MQRHLIGALAALLLLFAGTPKEARAETWFIGSTHPYCLGCCYGSFRSKQAWPNRIVLVPDPACGHYWSARRRALGIRPPEYFSAQREFGRLVHVHDSREPQLAEYGHRTHVHDRSDLIRTQTVLHAEVICKRSGLSLQQQERCRQMMAEERLKNLVEAYEFAQRVIAPGEDGAEGTAADDAGSTEGITGEGPGTPGEGAAGEGPGAGGEGPGTGGEGVGGGGGDGPGW